MQRSILVPLDGSRLAERALPAASALARAARARLLLVHAERVYAVGGLGLAEFDVVPGDDSQAYLDAVARRFEFGGRIQTVVAFGDPTRAIVDTALDYKVDMVVMATHGRTGITRWAFGSVAEAVLSESPAPVFLVRGTHVEQTFLAPGEEGRVLVPLDGSSFAERALPAALDLSIELRWPIEILSAAPVPQQVLRDRSGAVVAFVDQQVQDKVMRTRDYLRNVACRLAEAGIPMPIKQTVRVGAPWITIAEAADRGDRTIVVMATHARHGLVRAHYGSVAGEVLRRVVGPVVLVPPSDTETFADPDAHALLDALATSRMLGAGNYPAIKLPLVTEESGGRRLHEPVARGSGPWRLVEHDAHSWTN